MTQHVNFLQPDTDDIRHQIRGIRDSYSHEWDLLAELSQNAIDSIRRSGAARGHIYVEIDSANRKVIFEDNGTGIDPVKLTKLMRPFATDKIGTANQVGQKGVGITFAIFSSSIFELDSWHPDGARKTVIRNAESWLDQEDSNPIYLEVSDLTEQHPSTGVRVAVTISDPGHPIFSLTFPELKFLLLTRTALGDTQHIWGEPLNADVKLKHVDQGGQATEEEFDCKYLLPTQGLSTADVITVEEYEAWRGEADRSDPEKRRKLKDKVIVTQGRDPRPGRTIKFWTCFVPQRDVWSKLSLRHGLTTVIEDQEQSDVQHTYVGFGGGVFISTKGMPTGISLDLRPRGSAGYVPNFFILVEDPALNFDIGRKYVPGRLQGSLKEKAYEQFREYINGIVKYVSGTVEDPAARWEKSETFDEIDELPELSSANSVFLKRPNAQEATVAAMFFEQLGRGALPDFKPMVSGYKNIYDLYAKWGRRKVVLEFKYEVFGLLKDFADERKMFNEIDILVVWEITERDIREIRRRGLTLNSIEPSTLAPASAHFPLASRQLILDGSNAIDVVVMRKILRPDE